MGCLRLYRHGYFPSSRVKDTQYSPPIEPDVAAGDQARDPFRRPPYVAADMVSPILTRVVNPLATYGLTLRPIFLPKGANSYLACKVSGTPNIIAPCCLDFLTSVQAL